jgi:hypothetical protein
VEEFDRAKSGPGVTVEREQQFLREIATAKATLTARSRLLDYMREAYSAVPGRPGEFTARAPQLDPGLPSPAGAWKVINDDNREALSRRTVKQNEPLMRLGVVDGRWRGELKIPQRNIGHIKRALFTPGQHKADADGRKYLQVDVLFASSPDVSYPGRLYEDQLPSHAEPNRDDHNQAEPVVTGYVLVNLDDLPESQRHALYVAGQEVHARVRCGNHALGYSLFHGVWEWFYEKVVFFF